MKDQTIVHKEEKFGQGKKMVGKEGKWLVKRENGW